MPPFDPVQATVDAAVQHGLDPQFAVNSLYAESSGQWPHPSPKGAVGYFQIMPGTAQERGIDPNDPQQNIDAGVQILADNVKHYNNDYRLASAAYNAGRGAVAKYGGVPPYSETQKYLQKTVPQTQQQAAQPEWMVPDISDTDAQAPAAPQANNPQQAAQPEWMVPDVTDADASGKVDPSKMVLGDGSVISGSKLNPLSLGSTAVYNSLRANKKLDYDEKNGIWLSPAGSKGNPVGLNTADQVPDVQEGAYAVVPSADGSTAQYMVKKNGQMVVPTDMGEGILQGAAKPTANLIRFGNWATGGNVPGLDDFKNRLDQGDAQRAADAQMGVNRPNKFGKFVGEAGMAGLDTFAMGAGLNGLSALPKVGAVISPVANLVNNGLSGAVIQGAAGAGLLTDKRDAGGIGLDMLKGGAAGGALHSVLSPLVSGFTPTAAAQTLNDAGVYVPAGSKMGGPAKWVEDLSTSFPFVGPAVRNARAASVDSFNRGAFNEALTPIATKIPDTVPVGHDLYNAAKKAVGDQYDATLPHMSLDVNDPGFGSGLAKVENDHFENLSPEQQKQFYQFVWQPLMSRTPANGSMTGQAFKDVDSMIGHQASNFSSSANPADRNLGAALQDAQQSIRSTVGNQPQNAAYAPGLDAANDAYANLTRLRQASQAQGSVGGEFSPNTLWSAVRGQDSSVGGGNIASGTARLQGFAEAGVKTLPKKLGDSGTADRLNGALLMNPHTALPAAAGMAISDGVLGTPAGRRAVDALLFQRPELLRKLPQLFPLTTGLTGSALPAAVSVYGRP